VNVGRGLEQDGVAFPANDGAERIGCRRAVERVARDDARGGLGHQADGRAFDAEAGADRHHVELFAARPDVEAVGSADAMELLFRRARRK
jgi:hypothetical protein